MKDERLYTLRWAATKIQSTTTEQSTKDLAHEQVKILNEMIGDKNIHETSISIPKSGMGLDWYPKAVRYPRRMKTRGKYPKGYPYGAVVHFTAGRSGGLKKAISSIEGGIANGYAFDVIADSGEIVQARPISEHGYHAGKSLWEKLVGSVSDDLIGIEINNAGKVAKVDENTFRTWFGTYLTKDEVRYVDKSYGCPAGYYHKYTDAQEKTLVEYLLWLKFNDPVGCFDFDFVRGHHEVSPGRKPDPGGALSMPMDKFRQHLKTEYKKIYG